MGAVLHQKKEGQELSLSELHEVIIDAAKQLEGYTIQTRRYLHQNPELSWQEENTLNFIKSEIASSTQNSPYKFDLVEKKGGIWLDMQVNIQAPRVLFRADIDALPIQEENDVTYASDVDGVMHACGHDCHAAMLLAAVKAFAEGLVTPKCNIRFVFQRAEEIGGTVSGGSLLVEEGVCQDVDAAYCLHVSVKDTPGLFLCKPGMKFCNPMTVEIEVETEGGHVASPFIGTNSLDVITSIITELRGVERLLFPPTEPVVFVPSVVKAGTAANIRPNRARVVFALRNFFSEEKKDIFFKHVKQKVDSIVSSYEMTSVREFKIAEGYPILINDPRSTRFVSSNLNSMGFMTDPDDLSFAGDDFAYYLQKVMGSYWVLGAWQQETLDHHTAKFHPDEKALYQGVAFWLLLGCRRPI